MTEVSRDMGAMTNPLVSTSDAKSSSVRRGHVLAIADDGVLVVESGEDTVPCDCICGSSGDPLRVDVGQLVLFIMPDNDSRGVVIGRIAPPEMVAKAMHDADKSDPPDTIVLQAKDSLTLRVGDGSITIRADGKILIKGKDLVSHAKNLNRIKGGAVAIN